MISHSPVGLRKKTKYLFNGCMKIMSKLNIFILLSVLYALNGYQPVIGRYLQNEEKIPSMTLNFFANLFTLVLWLVIYFAQKLLCFQNTIRRCNKSLQNVKTIKRKKKVEPVVEEVTLAETQNNCSSLGWIILCVIVTSFFLLVFVFVRFTKSASNLYASKYTSAVFVQLISITSPLFVSTLNAMTSLLTTIMLAIRKASKANEMKPMVKSDISQEAHETINTSNSTLDSSFQEVEPNLQSYTNIELQDMDSLVMKTDSNDCSQHQELLNGEISDRPSSISSESNSVPVSPEDTTVFLLEGKNNAIQDITNSDGQKNFLEQVSIQSISPSVSISSIEVPNKVQLEIVPKIDTRRIFTFSMALAMIVVCFGGILISLGSFSIDPMGKFTYGISLSLDGFKNPMENFIGIGFALYSNVSNAVYSIIAASSTTSGKNSPNKFRMGVVNLSIFQAAILTVLFFAGARVLNEPLDIFFRLSTTSWIYLLIYSFLIYFVADSLILLAVKLVGSNNATALSPTSLLFTLIFSAIFLQEYISNLWQFIGCAIVMAGVILFSVFKMVAIRRKIKRARRKLLNLPKKQSYFSSIVFKKKVMDEAKLIEVATC